MHIIEKMLGNQFNKVLSDLYRKAEPTINQQLFKKVVPQGFRFSDVRYNWIEATTCPLLICHNKINRKNTNGKQVEITLE
jgi:hypothetical protein